MLSCGELKTFSQRVYKTNIDFQKAELILTRNQLPANSGKAEDGQQASLFKLMDRLTALKCAWVNQKGHLNLRFGIISDVPVQLTRNGFLIIKGGTLYDDAKVFMGLGYLLREVTIRRGSCPPLLVFDESQPFELVLVRYYPGYKEMSMLAHLPFHALAKGKPPQEDIVMFEDLKNLADWLRANIPKFSPDIQEDEVKRILQQFLVRYAIAQLQVPVDLHYQVMPFEQSFLDKVNQKGSISAEETRFHVHQFIHMTLLESLFYSLKKGQLVV